jgi:DNA-binding response OmpR family regulator
MGEAGLGGRGKRTDRFSRLSRGADDYVTKPFEFPELFARLRAPERLPAYPTRG